MERDSLTGGGSDRVSSFLRHPRGREVGGERPRLVWIFCKGQGNFIIIQRVHTLLHTQRVMYAEICSDPCAAWPPARTRTHAPAPVRASGPSAHKPGAEMLVHLPPLSSLAYAHPCCHLQARDCTKANPKSAKQPRETRHPAQQQCTPRGWKGTYGGLFC